MQTEEIHNNDDKKQHKPLNKLFLYICGFQQGHKTSSLQSVNSL